MKKFIACLLVLLLVTGCGKNTAREAVERYLKKYKALDSEVLVDMENIIDKENLSSKNQDKYRDILKKQYKDLSYEVIEEEYDDEVSYVTVKISVYDLYAVQNDADVYLENNRDKFNDENGSYSEEKFMDYKLDKMKNTTNKIDYTVIFTVIKEDDKYVVEQPTENDLLKIHGIYNGNID